MILTNGQPVWRNWQTHKTQNLAGATSCGFKSHRRHETSNREIAGFFVAVEMMTSGFDRVSRMRSAGRGAIEQQKSCMTNILLIIQLLSKLATGIEPVTSSLPMRCATDCATPACRYRPNYYTIKFISLSRGKVRVSILCIL